MRCGNPDQKTTFKYSLEVIIGIICLSFGCFQVEFNIAKRQRYTRLVCVYSTSVTSNPLVL